MSADEPVRLAWVLDDRDALHHVSTWAERPPDDRPPVRCPVCREAVTLKLGTLHAHHAAHRPDSACPVQRWETALHLNTKHHLARALRGADALVVRHRCAHRFGVLGETVFTPGLVPCTAVRDEPLAGGWDAVRVEAGLSDVRPDVLLLRGGAPVAAIEVRRTHAVTDAKVERLAALGMPWCEVAASRQLYAELTAWTADRPLVVARTASRALWWCDAHRPRARRRRRAEPAERAWAARVVDRYLPDGRLVRDVLFVAGEARGKRVHAPSLAHREGAEPIASLAAGPKREVLRAAHAALRAWARDRRAAGERLDSPMSWAPAASLRDESGRWVAGTTLYPQRFRWDPAGRHWLRDPVVGARRWVLARRLDEGR